MGIGKDKDMKNFTKIIEQQRDEEKGVEKEVIKVIQTNKGLVREVAVRKRF